MKKNPVTSYLYGIFFRGIVLSLLALCLTAGPGHAQQQEPKITLSTENATVETILDQLRSRYGYSFIYKVGDLDISRRISIDVRGKNINEVLDIVLAAQPVKYDVRAKIIHINKQEVQKGVSNLAPEMTTLKGSVTDQSGVSVIGATVSIQGTTRGTYSGIDGTFTLETVPDNAVIRVSAIGYTPMDIPLNKRTFLSITLQEDLKAIDEVVVVGYGTQKKVNLTGAVEQVSSELLENRPAANVTQMLVGAVPNLNISLADGKPNRSASYNVRGATSIGQGGSALVLIDGVEGDPAMLNPNDIESVSVLKDAAASAVYGSRAPYGVVLITTKDPSKAKDKFSVTYSGSVAIQQPTFVPQVVTDGYVYARLFNDAWYNYRFNSPTGMNKTQDFSQSWMDTFRLRKLDGNPITTTVQPDGKYIYYGNTDYYDAIYKDKVISQIHDISVSGANGKLSYYLAGRIYDYDGLFNYTPDTYNTKNLRAKMSAQALKWLKVSNNFSFTYDQYRQPTGSPQEGSGVLWRSINDEGRVSAPIFNPDGTLTKPGAYAIGGLVTGNNYLDRITKTLSNTTTVNMSFLDNSLRVTGDFSFRTKDYTETKKTTAVPYSEYEGRTSYVGTPETDDKLKESLQLTTYLSTNAYVNYEKTFAERHALDVLAGYNYEQSTYKSTYVERDGLLYPDATELNLAIGEGITTSSNATKWRYAGAFFRLKYAYDDRYLLELNGRYDGSSKFPNNSQWGFFPSASAAWRVSEEHFWNVSPKAINNFKIRGSYGSLGNSNVSPYTYLETFGFSAFGTGSGSTARYLDASSKLRYTSDPGQIPDNLKWETAQVMNVGLDLGFLNGKINFTGDYYVRRTLDMYTVGPTLPDTFGTSAPKGNYADMSTYGYELSLSYNDSFKLANKPFSFGIRVSLADSYTMIDRYNNPSRDLNDYYKGQRLGEIWGFVCPGLFQNQEQIDGWWDGQGYNNSLMQTSEAYITYPGDMIIEDLNGNKKIDRGAGTVDDPGDRKIIGNSEARYRYTISVNAEWNNFFFSAMFDGVGKQDWFPSDESLFWGMYNRPYNQAPTWHVGNYWTEDNPKAYLPRYVGYYGPFNAGTANINDRYLQSLAYIRLKTLNFGYNLPKAWISKIHLSKASIYFSGENLWNWSPLYRHTRDFDVTVASKNSDSDISNSRGDGHNYPTMRIFSFGLSLTF